MTTGIETTGTPSTVRIATRRDVEPVARALARGYHHDPLFSWLIPDERRRRLVLPRFFDAEIRHVLLPQGTVWTTDPVVGAAPCTPPDRWRMPARTLAAHAPAFLRALGRDTARALAMLVAVEREHPDTPHYYVAYVGIEPEHQGRGLGSALVRPMLELCDEERLPGYLEATSERAAAFWGRHGFEVTKRIAPRGGPPMWLMWREPRSGGGR